MAKLKDDIEAIHEALDRLADVDPTPDNAQMIAGLVKSIQARLENVAPAKVKK